MDGWEGAGLGLTLAPPMHMSRGQITWVYHGGACAVGRRACARRRRGDRRPRSNRAWDRAQARLGPGPSPKKLNIPAIESAANARCPSALGGQLTSPRAAAAAAARPEPQPRVRFPALPATWPFVCYRHGDRARSRGRAGDLACARAPARAPARARRAGGRAGAHGGSSDIYGKLTGTHQRN